MHHVFKQWKGRPGLCEVNDRLSLCRLSGRIRLAASGHLERRGHIAHIKGGGGGGVQVTTFDHRPARKEPCGAGPGEGEGEGPGRTETGRDESEGKQEMMVDGRAGGGGGSGGAESVTF